MAGHEKLLKKVEQDCAKGQPDRALTRLKTALLEQPDEFPLAHEAARLCFELGRTLEAAGILRSAVKRFPDERDSIHEMLEYEFAEAKQLEIGEILYDSYLTIPDFDKAQDVVLRLSESDRSKLLTKLQSKVASITQDAPEDSSRLAGVLLAEALVLGLFQRPAEFASTLDRMLDLDPTQTEVVGKLCKMQLKQPGAYPELRILLARCYMNVDRPDLAVEQAVAAGSEESFRAQALNLLESAGRTTVHLRARAELLLREGRFDEALGVLADLETEEDSASAVRETLEKVPEACRSSASLRLMYARALTRIGATRLALQELQQAHEAGADPVSVLEATEVLAQKDAGNTDLLLLQARAALATQHPETAAAVFRTVLETEPGRADVLKSEIETACRTSGQDIFLPLLIEVYLQLEMPQEAAKSLQNLRATGTSDPRVLFDLSSRIASQYGLSATLLVAFVESALDTEHDQEARAAVTYYLDSPGARVVDFGRLLTDMIHERADLASQLGLVLGGLKLPPEVRLLLATAALENGHTDEVLPEFESLIVEKPEFAQPALYAVESHLQRNGDVPKVLLLAARLAEQENRTLEATQYLIRVLRGSPEDADNVSMLAERILQNDPQHVDAWHQLVFSFIEIGRYRHAREICHHASRLLPKQDQGFVHVAMGEVLFDSNQLQAAVGEIQVALGYDNAPMERIIAILNRIVESDDKHGQAQYLLAVSLLRTEADPEEAVQHLVQAIRSDRMLTDSVLDLLRNHAVVFENNAQEKLLEAKLQLGGRDTEQGVALLRRALELDAQLALEVLSLIEPVWDRGVQDLETGSTFARALHLAGQSRRACRLLADLVQRFPQEQVRVVSELEAYLEKEPLPEGHRILWEIFMGRGEQEAALKHLRMAIDTGGLEEKAIRELLEIGHRQMPHSDWVACRLAELESTSGNADRAHELWREVLNHETEAWDRVLESLRSVPMDEQSEQSKILEVDCLLTGRQGAETLEALGSLRDSFPQARAATLERYRKLVAQKTCSSKAELDLALLLKEDGQIEEATATLEEGMSRVENKTSARTDEGVQPDLVDRELYLTLASSYIEVGREQEGREIVARVLERPGDHQKEYTFLERLTRQGLLSRLKNLRETITGSPGNLRARLEVARLSLLSMDFEGARTALDFSGDSPVVETTRRYLLARSYADEEQPHVALAILRSLQLDDVSDPDLRRNTVYLRASCCERLGQYGEAHALFLQLMSEFPSFKDTSERVRLTYQRYLEGAYETRTEILEKRTHLDAI